MNCSKCNKRWSKYRSKEMLEEIKQKQEDEQKND